MQLGFVIEIRPSRLGDRAGTLGGIALALKKGLAG
jgi:hypothetical protein